MCYIYIKHFELGTQKKKFVQSFKKKIKDQRRSDIVDHNIAQYQTKHRARLDVFEDLETWRTKAHMIKKGAIDNLQQYLIQFEKQFEKNGGKILWAKDAFEARQHIQDIVEKHQIKTAVKSKSMITEEVELNTFLELLQVDVLESDLGEFIVQLRGESPYHIVTPAMHLSKEQVIDLYMDRFGLSADSTVEDLVSFTRKYLRHFFEKADLGITGANFLMADTGGICLVTNEGNARLTSSFPDTLISISGIEKIIPRTSDLDTLLPLIAAYGTGQSLTVYNTILYGPKRNDESDGPSTHYLILLDNGRSDIWKDPKLRESLYCIKCGSCLNACPIYKMAGGHSYETPYTGPIGSVLSQHLQLNESGSFDHLSHASSLCGKCSASCPVKIPIDKLLVHNRHVQTKNTMSELLWNRWMQLMSDRTALNKAAFQKKMAQHILLPFLWGSQRKTPQFKARSFSELWCMNEGYL